MKSVYKKFVGIISSSAMFIASFVVPSVKVFADNESDIKFIVNNPWTFSTYVNPSYPGREYRLSVSPNNNSSNIYTPSTVGNETIIYGIRYRLYTDIKDRLLFICNRSLDSSSSQNYGFIAYYTYDRLNYSSQSTIPITTSYTATYTDEGGASLTGSTIFYTSIYTNVSTYNFFYSNKYPFIKLREGQTVNSILYLFSTNDFSYLPWFGTTSDGGTYFPDGTNLNPQNTNTYTQVYNLMDVNNDNSVSVAEVNYYNNTYNTSYDYSVFNEGNDFDQEQFLYWVAVQIADGVENPGGGNGDGSGGGSGVGGAGVVIGDGSFTQSQTQSIAENAVNVTVTNNNELTQENMQYINQIINNSDNESQENPFQEAISNMNQFNAIARAFATLAGVVFGWLPWWVTSLLSLMFTILFVMIIFRLIHLFI